MKGGEEENGGGKGSFFLQERNVELSGTGINLQTGDAEKLKFKYFRNAPLQNVPTPMDTQVQSGETAKQRISDDARVDSDATATISKA